MSVVSNFCLFHFFTRINQTRTQAIRFCTIMPTGYILSYFIHTHTHTHKHIYIYIVLTCLTLWWKKK